MRKPFRPAYPGIDAVTAEALAALQERRDAARMPDPGCRMLPMAQVRTMPQIFQPRMSAVFEKHVSDLRTALRNVGDLASILVMPIDDHAVVIDGHHRLEAYRLEDRSTIPVEFFVGSVLDALLRSGSENSKVTLPHSLEQRGNFAWTGATEKRRRRPRLDLQSPRHQHLRRDLRGYRREHEASGPQARR